ncbi:hypothetical protein KUCAC02_028232, partial [Chaenocephalus aceratus]
AHSGGTVRGSDIFLMCCQPVAAETANKSAGGPYLLICISKQAAEDFKVSAEMRPDTGGAASRHVSRWATTHGDVSGKYLEGEGWKVGGGVKCPMTRVDTCHLKLSVHST